MLPNQLVSPITSVDVGFGHNEREDFGGTKKPGVLEETVSQAKCRNKTGFFRASRKLSFAGLFPSPWEHDDLAVLVLDNTDPDLSRRLGYASRPE